MAAVLLTVLFVITGTYALLSIRQSLQRYGAAALALRDDLKACGEWRDVRVTVREITLHPTGATILRPDFKGRARTQEPEHALPAAA